MLKGYTLPLHTTTAWGDTRGNGNVDTIHFTLCTCAYTKRPVDLTLGHFYSLVPSRAFLSDKGCVYK